MSITILYPLADGPLLVSKALIGSRDHLISQSASLHVNLSCTAGELVGVTGNPAYTEMGSAEWQCVLANFVHIQPMVRSVTSPLNYLYKRFLKNV